MACLQWEKREPEGSPEPEGYLGPEGFPAQGGGLELGGLWELAARCVAPEDSLELEG